MTVTRSLTLFVLAAIVLVVVSLLLSYRAPLAALVPVLTIGAAFLISRGLLAILPLLVKTGVATGATNRILRRFALGVSDVRLRV